MSPHNRLRLVAALYGGMLFADDGLEKLEPTLRGLQQAQARGGTAGLRREAQRDGIEVRSGRVRVRIALEDSLDSTKVAAAARRSGATVVSRSGDSLFAEVPVARLMRIASDKHVAAIYLDRPVYRRGE